MRSVALALRPLQDLGDLIGLVVDKALAGRGRGLLGVRELVRGLLLWWWVLP